MNRSETRRSRRSRIDRNYEIVPSNDLITGDFDDERTLDEEEALEGSEDTRNELSNLQKEGDMPLSELLHLYGYADLANSEIKDEDGVNEEGEDENEEDEEDDDDEEPGQYEPDLKQFYTEMVKSEENKVKSLKLTEDTKDLAKNDNNASNCTKNSLSKTEDETRNTTEVNKNSVTHNATQNNVAPENRNPGGPSRLLRSVSRPPSEEEEDDCDYSPDEEEWKKTIMVGSDYQAAIPEGMCKYDDVLPYENEDKTLWDPSPMTEEQIMKYLRKTKEISQKGAFPSGSHTRDDEQALYLLLQCGHNVEEALRRRKIAAAEKVVMWSEEECQNFESGLRNYGKDFYLIQKNKVRTRSVGELVQFYYLWKKTERHDMFAYKARLEKKKYALHPGITDYMDRFLEEQESGRDRSTSPNPHSSLLSSDNKRQRLQSNSLNNDDNKSPVDWEKSPVKEEPVAIDLPILPSGITVIPIKSNSIHDSNHWPKKSPEKVPAHLPP